MNGPDSNDHWKDLADEIGAEIPDEPQGSDETSQDVSPAIEGRPKPRREPTPPPPPPEADWDALAADLGIEPPPASEVPPESKSEPPPVPSQAAGGGTLDSWAESDTADRGMAVGEPEAATEDPLELPPHSDVSFEEFAEGMAAEVQGDVDEAESMFESPDESDAREVAERRQRRRRRRGRRGRGEATRDEASAETAAEAVEEESEARQEPTRDRRDRDRRESDEVSAPRRRRRRRRPAEENEVPAGTTKDSPGDEPAPDESPAKKHRNIPTWEEVVGSVIESNLGSRSRAPRGDNRRRRGGRRRS